MKIRVVSSKDEINTLSTDEEIIHLAFRPSNKDIFDLVQTCPEMKALHIPGSYKKTVSKSILLFLDMQNIKLLEGDVWGHRKDINDYYEIKKSVFDKINNLKQEGKSQKEILDKMKKETRLSPDLLEYLLKA
ncbi:MAG: DUF1699 family protein [Methanosarcinales archaeon]|nr:DUF1699 family protein [Methanosarcinales archaeon]